MAHHRNTGCIRRTLGFAAHCVAAASAPLTAVAAEVTFSPQADGTLVDGGPFGTFDGQADAWDWSFNQSSFEGSITLDFDPPQSPFESRLVCEFDLASVAAWQPLTAVLSFSLRGAPRFPTEPAEVHVYAYAADLLEQATDFSIAGSVVDSVNVAAYQPVTLFRVNVSEAANALLRDGGRRIGFRFQINPAAVVATSQAFMDAMDSNAASKPALTISDLMPADIDQDHDVDLIDFAWFRDCLRGPGRAAPGCSTSDFDLDGDVDLADLQRFESLYNVFAR